MLLLLLLLSAQLEKTKPLEPETFLTFDYEMNTRTKSQEKNENFRVCAVFRFAKKFSLCCSAKFGFQTLHSGFT